VPVRRSDIPPPTPGDQALFTSYRFGRIKNGIGVEREARHLVADRQHFSVANDERFLALTLKRDASIAGVDQYPRHRFPSPHTLRISRPCTAGSPSEKATRIRRRERSSQKPASSASAKALRCTGGDECRVRSLDRAICQRKAPARRSHSTQPLLRVSVPDLAAKFGLASEAKNPVSGLTTHDEAAPRRPSSRRDIPDSCPRARSASPPGRAR
jgi:hypothetical protein